MRILPALPLAAGLAAFGWSLAESAPSQSAAAPTVGEDLYLAHCASCHGRNALGVEGRGPDLIDEGRAAVDFVLTTGRMPMADPDAQATRGPVRFSEDEISALVDFVGALGDGPEVPDVETVGADVALGAELYRLNCAACHVASGAGAPIGSGREAPSLMSATPTQVGEAILVGPGAMPRFGSFDSSDIDDVAAYVERLQADDTSGVGSLGGAGPVAEGLAAWLLVLLPIVALTRWIGTPHPGRDRHAHGREPHGEERR